MTLTDKEARVLKALAYNYFGEGSGTWCWAVNDSNAPSGVTGKALAAVVGSLEKKGLVRTDGGGREGTISTTDAGFAEMAARGWKEG